MRDLDKPVSRRLKHQRLTYRRQSRAVIVTLIPEMEAISFRLEGCEWSVSRPLGPLFWDAMHASGATRKKPRTREYRARKKKDGPGTEPEPSTEPLTKH